MIIRKARPDDLDACMKIYAYAREAMRKSGNPSQWGDSRPAVETVQNDIACGNLYVIEDEQILGVFAFIKGADPTYARIENGDWLNDEPYGTIHRIASSGVKKGVMKRALDYCEAQVGNVRVDTHKDNKIMQHILEKNGYNRTGIIYIADGSPRIAYQKVTGTIK